MNITELAEIVSGDSPTSCKQCLCKRLLREVLPASLTDPTVAKRREPFGIILMHQTIEHANGATHCIHDNKNCENDADKGLSIVGWTSEIPLA